MTAYRLFLERMEATRTLGVAFGLERMHAALGALGAPHEALPAVHIAGTNGKGSTAAMVDAVLRASGLATGLFTSPHLSRFTERIRVRGAEIDGERLAALGERVFATGVPLTYFEVATVLGFLAMAEAGVDVAILEVGLGGRLDATNTCRPVATAITSIGLDHTEMLGPDLASIAREKAGIAKPGVPLLCAPLPPEAAAEVARVAGAVGAPVVTVAPGAAEREALARVMGHRLPGAHQIDNAALAVAVARQVAHARGTTLAEAAIAHGLGDVHWPGRLEEVVPGVWLDAAHNAEGARALVAALPPGRARALVVSIVHGKPVAEMATILAPAFQHVVVTRSASARAHAPAALAALWPAGGASRVEVVDDPRQAVSRASALAPEVVVAGSIFLLGEVRAALLGEPVDPLVTGDPMPAAPRDPPPTH